MMANYNETVNYEKFCEELEKQELDAPDGVPPAHIYQQLLAIYLLQNELSAAKFLWKRIPTNSKSSTPELAKIWEVGQNLWQRDFQGVYSSISKDWSPSVKPIMEALKEKLSERAINLVSLAYASIGLDDLAQILNLSREDALARAKELLWTFDQATQMVFPTKPKPKMHAPLPSEDQLRRLAEYVSFLEN
ncbi:UNVERIFIED_CONTAM: hypothetical protein RMT77_005981 [Armadillidium vulgare]